MTTLTAIRTIYDYLKAKNAKAVTAITGNVYWLSRPKNSRKEDIVVNAIALSCSTVQEGLFNINIHVPNLKLDTDDTQPDFVRMEAIANALEPLLKDVWGYDWNFEIDEPGTPVQDGTNWFVNIRIRYYTVKN